MTIKFPAALYAKAVGHRDGVSSQFRWQGRDLAFPDRAFEAADRWCQRFQWVRAQERQHGPVAVWLPLGPKGRDGVLMLRFADIGQDDCGRWGTLRLEAVYAPPEWEERFPNLPAQFLRRAVLAECLLDEGSGTQVTFDDCEPDAPQIGKIMRLARSEGWGGLLASCSHQSYILSDSEGLLVLDSDTWERVEGKPSVAPVPRSETPSSPAPATPAPAATPPRPVWRPNKRHHLPWLMLAPVLVVAMVGCVLASYAWKMKEKVEAGDTRLLEYSNERNRLQEECERLKERNADLRSQLQDAKGRLRASEAESPRDGEDSETEEAPPSALRNNQGTDVHEKLRRLRNYDDALAVLKPLLSRLAEKETSAKERKALNTLIHEGGQPNHSQGTPSELGGGGAQE